jgi:hypothetical protein
MNIIRTSLGLAACGAATLIAYAAVTFDPETGTGFVGKGDVQLECNWNNAELQARAAGVLFAYVDETVLEQDCVDTDRGVHTVMGVRTKTTGVSSEVEYEKRKNSQLQINGFILTGFGAVTVIDDDWNNGGSGNGCPDGTHPMGAVREGSSISGGLVILCPSE